MNMLRKIAVAVSLWLMPFAAFGQIPGGNDIVINQTPVIGGTNGQCLYVNGMVVGNQACSTATGTVTSVSVVTANGFAGTVATATTTPAITLTTTITGILSGNGTAISAASTTGTGSVVLASSPSLTTPALTGSSTGITTLASANAGASNFTITFPAATGIVALTSGANVASVSNSDGTLTISPTTGAVVASLNLSQANTWLAQQTDQGASGTSPGWYAQIAGDTTPRVRVGINANDIASIGFGPGNAVRDTFLEREASGVLAQRNSTTAQLFKVYTTYTNSSNGRWVQVDGTNGAEGIYLNANGTGINTDPLTISNVLNGALIFGTNNSNRWQINSSGHMLAVADNTYDIGASGATRPRNLYAGTSLNAPKAILTGGTLADQAQVLSITATQPASPTGAQNAITWDITSAGSASQTNQAWRLNYAAGYTGSSRTVAARLSNAVAGTGSNLVNDAGAGPIGNIGVWGDGSGSTSGLNIGGVGYAEAGTKSVGLIGVATLAKNSATNIGVVGVGLNTGTSPVQIGGFFSLLQQTTPSVSAALIADNGSQTDAIFLARDNGSTVFTIADGGNVTATAQILAKDGTAGSPSYSWSSTGTMGFYRIGSNNIGLSFASALAVQWENASFGQVMSTGYSLAFSSNTTVAGVDAVLSRQAAGILQVGTTAANALGTIAAATANLGSSISSAAWTTSGIRLKLPSVTLTDTSSSGTVAVAYTNLFAGSTIAASSSTTFSDYYNVWFDLPAAGSNVTLTRRWVAGFNGNVNMGGNVQDGSAPSWQIVNSAIRMQGSSGKFYFTDSSRADGNQDTTYSRNAAGVHQFGTTANNALGTILAANATFSSTAVKFTGIGTDAAQTDSTLCILSDGTVVTGTGTLGVCLGSSSARYKDNIIPLNAGLAQVAMLEPKAYRYKKGYGDDGAREQYGLIAEDVVKALPDLVGLDKNGRPNSVDLVGMIPVLVQAVKELKADNDNLRSLISRRASR